MAAEDRRGRGLGPSVTRIRIDDRDRPKSRTLLYDRERDAPGTAEISLPLPLAQGDPMEQALRQIREVAMIPVGQILLSTEERIRALTAKVERINIAEDGEPDEDWRPALIEEANYR